MIGTVASVTGLPRALGLIVVAAVAMAALAGPSGARHTALERAQRLIVAVGGVAVDLGELVAR